MFERISIGIKTFLRDEKLFRACDSIIKTMPDAHIIVADDGEMNDTKAIYYEGLESLGHKVICLPFDSGFGVKSNKIIDALARPYLLVASDDFCFSAPDVVVGVKKMLDVLDRTFVHEPQISIASGRLRNRGQYEFLLVESNGEIIEVPCNFDQYPDNPGTFGLCDVTFNYSLIRREVFYKKISVSGPKLIIFEARSNIKFDDEEIIGEGGHGAFFYDCKKANIKVAYVPGVFIDEMPEPDSERYRQYRHRACGSSRKCFEKRNIRKYVLGDGRVDYERKEQ